MYEFPFQSRSEPSVVYLPRLLLEIRHVTTEVQSFEGILPELRYDLSRAQLILLAEPKIRISYSLDESVRKCVGGNVIC